MNLRRCILSLITLAAMTGCTASTTDFCVSTVAPGNHLSADAIFRVVDEFARRHGFAKEQPNESDRIDLATGKPTGLDMHSYVLPPEAAHKYLPDAIFLQASRTTGSRIFIQIISGDRGRNQVLIDQLRQELIAELTARFGHVSISDLVTM